MFGRQSGKSENKKEVFENRIIFRDWGRGNWFKEGVDPALSALMSIVEAYGEFGFDTEKIKADSLRDFCDAWIAHLTQGGPSPLTMGPKKTVEKEEIKDWRGLCRWLSSQRRDEKDYVEKSFASFRGLLWDFIRELGAVVNDDRSSDQDMRKQLNGLESSVQSATLNELRTQVLATVRSIHDSIEKREQKRTEQTKELGQKLKKMKAELADARSQMVTDPLTQVYNRRSFDDQIQKFADFSQLSGNGASLLILDIDDFKEVNDQWGHQAGDAALKFVADCCVRGFPRQSDYIARYGGDEFVIIIDEARPEVCRHLGRRLLDSIAEHPFAWNGTSIPLAASAGIACLLTGEPSRQWFERADAALRLAKREGKNHLIVDTGEGSKG